MLWSSGKVMDRGVSTNALDNPLLAVAWLANRLNRDGVSLKAGDIVLTGVLTRGYLAQRDQAFVAEFNGLGTVKQHFY